MADILLEIHDAQRAVSLARVNLRDAERQLSSSAAAGNDVAAKILHEYRQALLLASNRLNELRSRRNIVKVPAAQKTGTGLVKRRVHPGLAVVIAIAVVLTAASFYIGLAFLAVALVLFSIVGHGESHGLR